MTDHDTKTKPADPITITVEIDATAAKQAASYEYVRAMVDRLRRSDTFSQKAENAIRDMMAEVIRVVCADDDVLSQLRQAAIDAMLAAVKEKVTAKIRALPRSDVSALFGRIAAGDSGATELFNRITDHDDGANAKD
jgi:hypothetical protein